jgi:hypothetical protein
MSIDLEEYKTCFRTHRNILTHLEDMIHMCDEFENNTRRYLSVDEKELLTLKDFKEVCVMDKQYMERQMKKIQRKIHENCPHEFVYDAIDIDPDRSQYIKYCELCELTVEPFILPSSTKTQVKIPTKP